MNIGIIGAGNMSSALAGGLIASEIIRPDELSISDKNPDSLLKWQTKGVFTTEDNAEVLKHSDIIIFAVKPNILPLVLEEAKAYTFNKIFISIAAGVTIETIEGILGRNVKIIRAMPNTPAKVNCGMTVIAPNRNITKEELAAATDTLSGWVGRAGISTLCTGLTLSCFHRLLPCSLPTENEAPLLSQLSSHQPQ